jgi:hypothetical protein
MLCRYFLSSSLISGRSTTQNHIAGEGSAKHAIVTLQILLITHTCFHMTKKQNSYHQPNADLMGVRAKRIIGTHPIPLVIRFLFIRLGYLARIVVVAHQHMNTTRQTGVGSSRHHPWFTGFTMPWHPTVAQYVLITKSLNLNTCN